MVMSINTAQTSRPGKWSSGVRRQSEAPRRVGISAARRVRERQMLSEPRRCRAPLAVLLARITQSLRADPVRRSQAKGLVHTSPGQRPGFPCGFVLLQANGLPHGVHWDPSADGHRQASIPQHYESRFQRWERSLADKPRALPWAGMNDAVGVSNRPACGSSVSGTANLTFAGIGAWARRVRANSPCKEQPVASALQSGWPEAVRQSLSLALLLAAGSLGHAGPVPGPWVPLFKGIDHAVGHQ